MTSPLMPVELLKHIKCYCVSELSCNIQIFGCNNANLICLVSCACQRGQGCFNEKTKQANQIEDDNDEDLMCFPTLVLWICIPMLID